MNVLVIPDSHLRAWMFDSADKIIQQHKPDKVVVLGDLVDDWDQQRCVVLYQKMMDKFGKNVVERKFYVSFG